MQDVFISYARDDAPRVRQLAERLVAARGWSMWWDTALRPGEQFPREIQKALTSARCVLVVWSPRSVDSEWVIAEASEGWERQALVPALIEACEPPLPFRQTQAADLSDWRGAPGAPALLALIDSIDRVLLRQAPPAADELAAREARMRAQRRRRFVRTLVVGAVAVAVIGLGALAYRELEVRRGADALAAQAEELRRAVLELDDEERTRIWWYVLMEDSQRLERLELATLLAIEAFRTRGTDATEAALRGLLAISPWSDEHMPIEHGVGALAFTPDGRYVVAGGGPGDTLVWDRAARQISARIAHGGMAGAERWTDARGRSFHRGAFVLDASPAEAIVATAGPDHDAALWDVATGRALARLAHEDTVTAVSFAPAGDVLATVTEAGVVRLWDVRGARELGRMAQGSAAYWVGVSPGNRYVASASADGNARVWGVDDGALVATLATGGPVDAARFSPDERWLATFGQDLEATALWDVGSGARAWAIPIASNDAAGVVFGAGDRTLVIGGVDGALGWWDMALREETRSVALDDFIIGIAADAARTRIATTAGAVARVWDVSTGQELRQMPYARDLTAVALSRDGRFLASAGADGEAGLAIEVTEVRPEDPVAAACARVRRNLSRSEWGQYLGASASYRPTCAQVEDAGP